MNRDRKPKNAYTQQRARKSRLNDLWVEIYGPDVGVVESMCKRVLSWALDNKVAYTGPAYTRQWRWFSLFDYADRDHLADEQRVKCLVGRFGLINATEEMVDEMQKMVSPVGARMMVRTRTPWKPVAGITVNASSAWRDE